MKNFKLFFLLTNFILFAQMCNKNINNIGFKTKEGKLDATILSCIIREKVEDLKALLQSNKDVNLNEIQKDQTYLHYAIRTNNREIIELLISSGANPDIFLNNGNLLICALSNNKINSIDALLRAGAKVPENSNLLLEIILLIERLSKGHSKENDFEIILKIFKEQFFLKENWLNKTFSEEEKFKLIYFIAPFETMNEELIYLIKEMNININSIEPKDKKGITLYQAISKGAFSNIKILLENGADIKALSKHRPIELLFRSLSSSMKKYIKEKEYVLKLPYLLKELLNLINTQIDVRNELANINPLNLCKDILNREQLSILKLYLEFNAHIKKEEILDLIIMSNLGGSCFKFLLEEFNEKFYKEDIILALAKESFMAKAILNKNKSSLSLGKDFSEILEMINYFLKEKEFLIKDEEKMVNALSKIIFNSPNEETLKLLEENFHEYIAKTKGTTYSLIHAAAKNGNVELFNWTLKFFSINDEDPNKETVIESALKKKNEPIAHLLIQLGVYLPYKTSVTKKFALPQIRGKKDLNSTNLLKNSVEKSSQNLIKDFIQNHYTFGEETLIENVRRGRLNVINFLLTNNIFKNINYVDKDTKTALDYAMEIKGGNTEEIIKILKKYNSLTAKDLNEKEKLFSQQMEKKNLKKLAAHKKQKQDLERLKAPYEEETPSELNENEIFHKAIKEKNFDSIVSLLKKENSRILKILPHAEIAENIFKGFPQIFKFKDKNGNNLLIISIINNYFDTVVKILNSNSIDMNETDLEGNTPLMLAALENKIGMFEFLINKTPKEHLNRYNNKGQNLLIISVENRSSKLLNLISRKEIFNFDNIGEVVINLIFSSNEKEKPSTLKTLLNIMKDRQKYFKEDEILKLKRPNLSKEIIEVLSKFSEEFKILLNNLELNTQINNNNLNIEEENIQNEEIENIKAFLQNGSGLDEWEDFIDSTDIKIKNNLNVFKSIIDEIKVRKNLEINSKKKKFISKNLYEMKINSTRIFYSIKEKNLIILGVILNKDDAKSSRAIEYLKENIIKSYEKWEIKKFADL